MLASLTKDLPLYYGKMGAKIRVKKELDANLIKIMLNVYGAQRKAMKDVFMDILCFLYHFYFLKFVIKALKGLDNSLMTQTRKSLCI